MATSRKPGKSQRLKRLLEAGYFPAELPPPFVSRDLARYRVHLRKTWPAGKLQDFKSVPETFSIPRFGSARRSLSLVNPINYFKIATLIAENWSEVRKHLIQSPISEFKPIFDTNGDRAFFGLDFDNIEQRTNKILAGFHFALKTDIIRYYPTIYTHSIAWALYGKQYTKANMHTPAFKAGLGNQLDVAIRRAQDNQSIGIPIGPDTSRILGEIIGVGIEIQLKRLLTDLDRRGLRYVDDLLVGYTENESEDSIVSLLTQAISEFGLDINVDKTEVIGNSNSIRSDWIPELRNFRLPRSTTSQQDYIEHFFKISMYHASNNKKDAVLVYAIKRSRAFEITKEAWNYYTNWLLRASRKYPACLPSVAQILIEQKYKGKELDIVLIRDYIRDMIRIHAPIRNYFEVAWILFLAKGLNLSLSSIDLKSVFVQESSICALLTLDLDSRGLIDGGADTSFWQSHFNADALTSNMWLLAYEARLKNWLPKHNPCFVESHPLFGPMLKKKIEFYDTKRNVRTTKSETKSRLRARQVSRKIFAHLSDYF